MSNVKRFRCPRCGVCYERNGAAAEIEARPCGNCGVTTVLYQEAPGGLWSGALPPLSPLLALAIAAFFCLAAIRYSVFAMFAFGSLVVLFVSVFLEHQQRRADRIKLWNLLIKTYAEMDQEKKRLLTDLVNTKKTQE
jgi:hypothetical protein